VLNFFLLAVADAAAAHLFFDSGLVLLIASATAIKVTSDPICNSAGCTQYKHPASKDSSYPMDYGVPDFGMDRNIQDNFENLKIAEGIVGHHWVGIDKEKWANAAKKTLYNYDMKLDGDIIDSQKNLAATEKKLGMTYTLAWNLS